MTQADGFPSRVVVFDFDGTLVNRDSFIDFSIRYCRVRPARLLFVIAVLPLAMLAALRSREIAGSVLLWAMTVGSSTRSFVVALRHYAAHTLRDHVNEAVFQELVGHVRQGSRVVIATGTSPLLVRGVLSARGCGRLPVVGSRFRRRWGGLVVETYCTETTKVQELERRLRIAKWSVVYTNSFSDRWLMSRAEQVIFVGPSSRALLRIRSLMGQSASIRVLRPEASSPPDQE